MPSALAVPRFDDELEPGRLRDRQVGGLCVLEERGWRGILQRHIGNEFAACVRAFSKNNGLAMYQSLRDFSYIATPQRYSGNLH